MRVRRPKKADWGHWISVRANPDAQKEMRIWLRQCVGPGKQIRRKRGPEQLGYFHMWYYRPEEWESGFGGYVSVTDVVDYHFLNDSAMAAFILRWNEYCVNIHKPEPKNAPYLYEELFEDEPGQAQLTPKEQRAKFILDKFGPQWQGLPGYDSIQQFVQKVAAVDPTPKGIYMPWIARLTISKPEFNRAEDLDRVGSDLAAFEKFKPKIANKDINAYKSFDELFGVIEPFLVKRPPTPEEKAAARDAAKLAKVKGGIIDVYSSAEGWIKIPTTKDAAKFLGQNTRWCTAASANNMFDNYNARDRLFVIYDKASKKRFQLHIADGQFANEADKNQGVDAVPLWARQPIVDYYKKTNQQLTFKQIMNLNSFTDENLAAGTDHEDILALMKQYGV